MKHQLYDLRNLDDDTRASIVRNEVDMLLDNQLCSICNGAFIGRKEKDNTYCSGTKPLTFAHDYCWEKQDER